MLPWIERYEHALEELELYYQLGGYNQERSISRDYPVRNSFAVRWLAIVF